MSDKLSKTISFLLAATTALLVTACSSTQNIPDDPFSSVTLTEEQRSWSNQEDKYAGLLDTYGKQKCSGVIAVATDKDLVYLYCEDDVEKDGTTPVSQDTVFDIASMSKVFTAVSILQLAEKGKLSIDDTLDKYFPEYETGRNITLYNLLHMNSGISDYLNNPDPFWNISGEDAANKQLSDIYLDNTTDDEFLAALYQAPLESEPGSKYSYSNTNYRLLAMIIEQITGEKYCNYVKKNIFDKCGMTKTSSMATGDLTYAPRGFEELVEYGFCSEDGYPACPNNSRGDGGIHSCMTDMVAFDRALFGGKLLNEKSMEILLKEENSYCCGLKKEASGYAHDGSSLTCMGNNKIIESGEFGHVYVIRLERTGSVQPAEGELPDPMAGTNYTKGIWENGCYTNEYAGIKLKLSDEYEQVGEAMLNNNVPNILADCTEEKDWNREAATKWDCFVYSMDTDIHDNISIMYVNTELAATDTADYTEDNYLDDRIAFSEFTEGDGWSVGERKTVLLGGKEYVRQIVSGYDSFSSLNMTNITYARKIDDNLMAVIIIAAFYDNASPEDYEKLFM